MADEEDYVAPAYPIDPQVLELARGMTAQEFGLWRTQPAGRLFFAFLEDQLHDWRYTAADLVMNGRARPHDPSDARHEMIGGQMRAFADLARITLATIQGFYRESAAGPEPDDGGTNEGGPRQGDQ